MELLEKVLESAKNNLVKYGSIAPVIIFLKEQSIIMVEAIPFSNDNEKVNNYIISGVKAKFFAADSIIMINDVALRKVDQENSKHVMDNYDTEAPLLYPKSMREEAIFLTHVNLLTKEIKTIIQTYSDLSGIIFKDRSESSDKDTISSNLVKYVFQGYSMDVNKLK